MKLAAAFLLTVGFLWAVFVVWMFLTIAGISDSPRSMIVVILYWGGMLLGPCALVVGAALLLRGVSLRSGGTLILIGCLIFTGYALYNSIIGMQWRPLQAPPPYLFYLILLLIMILADGAAYKVYKVLTADPRAFVRVGQ